MIKLPHVLFFPVCGLLFVFFPQSQCRVGPGHRGFSNGVGGLFFAALSSKSCLSVLSSWTSCNNINGPLNSLLCCAALVWVTSHTCTLSRSEMHAYGRGTAATLLAHKAPAKNPAFARSWRQVDGHTRNTALPIRAAQTCADLCLTMIDHLHLCCHCSRRPICLSPLFVCLFVCVDRLLGGLCLFLPHHLSH